MTHLRVVVSGPPEAAEVVRPEELRELVLAADRELGALERRAADASDAADRAEARARELGVDFDASEWATARLHEFLDQLRSEAEGDAEAAVAIERERARAQADHGRLWGASPGDTEFWDDSGARRFDLAKQLRSRRRRWRS